MRRRHCVEVLAAVLAISLAPASAAHTSRDPGPAPTQREFYEAADRAAYRIFGTRIAEIDWREPRRGAVQGYPGYIVCGDVRLSGRAAPVVVMAIWRRGDIEPFFLEWRSDGTDVFASQWDLPMWVSPLRATPELCAAWVGEPSAWELRQGERFTWSPPPPWPPNWRRVRDEERRLRGPDEFSRFGECVRIRSRPGRRYRVTVEASVDTSISILTDRDCAGNDNVVRWNDDASSSDRNPQVEFDGVGAVYAYITEGIGSRPSEYRLIVEEGDVRSDP